MKKNIGKIDQTIRIVLAILLITLQLLGVTSGILGFLFWVIAITLIITSISKFCPLYSLLKLNSCPLNNNLKK